jgi:hypothetical protein
VFLTLRADSKSCAALTPQKFEEMLQGHEPSQPSREVPDQRLYFASRFTIKTDGTLAPAEATDRMRIIDSLLPAVTQRELVITLPYFDPAKCSAK